MSHGYGYVGAQAPQPLNLIGGFNEIIGWQNAGRPTRQYHGMYGGRNFRGWAPHFGGYGGNAWAPRYGGHFGFGQQYPDYNYSYYGPSYTGVGADIPVGPGPVVTQVDASIPPRNQMVDRGEPRFANRMLLPMSSGVAILPGTTAQVTARPQGIAFQPQRVIIGNNPQDWVVNDIKVGNESQLAQSGDLPGEMFSSTTVDGFVSFRTVQSAMDFVMQVTYIGNIQEGSAFICGVLGVQPNY
jgi:hypothetical protein